MRKQLIESYIDKLRASFGPVKAPVVEEELRILYDTRDYAGMIRHIKRTLRLDMRVFLSLVNKGGPDAPAWIKKPEIMPPYGTMAFRQVIVVMHLRKAFLQDANFEETVLAIAHEFCHVVLDAVRHPLRKQEEAVDLTAMLLGFRDFYVTGCRSQRVLPPSPAEVITGSRTVEIKVHGYLTFEEVGHAAEYMTFR